MRHALERRSSQNVAAAAQCKDLDLWSGHLLCDKRLHHDLHKRQGIWVSRIVDHIHVQKAHSNRSYVLAIHQSYGGFYYSLSTLASYCTVLLLAPGVVSALHSSYFARYKPRYPSDTEPGMDPEL